MARYLIVAHQTASSPELLERVKALHAGDPAAEFTLLVPATPTGHLLHNWEEGEARQLARAIASDLTLYHEGKIIEGITNDSLFDVMKEEIEEGRALFRSRVTDDIYGLGIYERAIVDVLIKSKGHIKSKIW